MSKETSIQQAFDLSKKDNFAQYGNLDEDIFFSDKGIYVKTWKAWENETECLIFFVIKSHTGKSPIMLFVKEKNKKEKQDWKYVE